jgi:alpha-tubulin suppressor-like RCC1 family protein
MNKAGRWWKVLGSTLVAAALCLERPAAQAPTITVAPENPTIVVGHTQQFMTTGVSTPVSIAGGGYHTCILMSDQSVRCFGENNWGQLGNGSFANSATPIAVSGMTTAVVVGAGIEHSCALVADGTVRCWGTNFVGQLGDGTFGSLSAVPKTVQGIANAASLAAGGFHNCALLSDRTVKCWGRNQDGQIGNGDSTTDVSPPQQAVAGLTSVAAIAAGGYHSCALLQDGTARCWGRNSRGQLGDGTSVPSSTPVTVSGLTTGVALTAGLYHTCALLRDGSVQCWGENSDGQIGSTLAFSSVPVTVSAISGAVAVSAGVFHTCALLSDGTARCWGQNANGQLGNGTTANSPNPVTVSGLTAAIGIAGAGLHSCALMANRSAQCWGWNVYGQLGNGTTTDSTTPVAVRGFGLTWTSSNPAVASIDGGGKATGIARGTTTITVADDAGNTASTTLTVTDVSTLSVATLGTGGGTVTSSPAGINCGTDCAETHPTGTAITLTSTPDNGSLFGGWTGGGCAGTGNCSITLTADTTISARFDRITFPLTVSRTGGGTGAVTSSPAGISCGTDCTETYVSNTSVTLSAAPGTGSFFAGWTGGGCTGAGACVVNIAAATTVAARFELITFSLGVARTGAGTGSVGSSPAGVSCGTDCSETYPGGTVVTLTAAPGVNSLFAGWTGGGCAGTGTCAVTMAANTSIGARFDLLTFPLAVARSGSGVGTVTSSPAGINCGADCAEPYTSGTVVTLTAIAASGSVLTGWTGCSTVSGATCTVTMSAARTVTATFARVFTLTVQKSGLIGGGTVSSSPAGISCGNDCSESYVSGTTVTLTATPGPLSVFTGWSGCDTASGRICTVTMNAAKSVTAGFLGIMSP